MGEEQKKPEEKKQEETKKEKSEEAPKDEKVAVDGRKDDEEKKSEEQALPSQEIVLKVYMHCEGCARKVRRCLKGFEGVEAVITDCRTSKVIVRGEKADPLKVLERIQRKSHRQVELISPIPKPPIEEPKKTEDKAVAKAEEKKEEPKVIAVVLGVYMHCEACAQEIKKRILKMKGVESAEPELKCSQVKVKGIFEPEKLVDYIHKRTGKHVTIAKVEPEKKDEDKPKERKEDKKPQEAQKEEETENKENKEGGGRGESGGPPPPPPPEAGAEDPKLELKKNELYYYNYPQNYLQHPQRFVQEYYAYPPQIFSDENPNACCVM